MNKKMYTPPCDACGQKKVICPFSDIPAMVGFQMEDGKVINLCSDCLKKLGSMDDKEKDEFFERLGIKHE